MSNTNNGPSTPPRLSLRSPALPTCLLCLLFLLFLPTIWYMDTYDRSFALSLPGDDDMIPGARHDIILCCIVSLVIMISVMYSSLLLRDKGASLHKEPCLLLMCVWKSSW